MAGKSFKVQMNPTFKAAVKIPRVGGEPLAVTFEFKTFARKELARLFDGWKEANIALMKEADERKEQGDPLSLEEWTDREVALQVQQVKDIVKGWGFSDEFNDENIEELVESSVSVTDVILEQYNDAYSRARSGN